MNHSDTYRFTAVDHKPRVAVVGAGIAGLTAAYQLMQAGINVCVFEKADGVGGRMGDRRVGDVAFNSGARLVYPFGADFHGLVADLGLKDSLIPLRNLTAMCVRPDGRHLIELMPSHRSLMTPGLHWGERLALIRHALKMGNAKHKVSPDWAMSAMTLDATYDDMSLADYIGSALGRNVLKQMVEPVFRATRSFNPEDISALFYLSTVPHLIGEQAVFTLKGGMGTVCNALARQLNIRTGTAVVAIEQPPAEKMREAGSDTSVFLRHSASITLRFENEAPQTFDYVICAVEGALAKNLVKDPLPAESAMLDRVRYNALGVVHYGFAKPLPPTMEFAVRGGQSRIATYQQLPAAPLQGRPLTQIYCQLTPEAANEARECGLTQKLDILLRNELKQRVPDFDANVTSVVNQWIPHKLPIFSAGYGRALSDFWQWQEASAPDARVSSVASLSNNAGTVAAGTKLADCRGRIDRPLIFCGDWTAQALLTGACASGVRAAKIVIDRVRRRQTDMAASATR